MTRIASIGECMLEIASAGDGMARLGYAGDTYNAAYYLSHLSGAEVGVSYVTCVGTDPLSEEMLAAWRAAGIDCSRVGRVEDRIPGAYLIRTSDTGERSFVYWRESSAARRLFERPAMDGPAVVLAGFDVVYLSGITLAILSPHVRAELVDALSEARARGAWTVFDPNYRPRLWAGPDVARDAFRRIAGACTLLLPSFDDEQALFGDESPAAAAERWRAWGAGAVAVKDADRPVHVLAADGARTVPVPRIETVVDSTAAGDSFNAGVLAMLVGDLGAGGLSAGAIEEAVAFGGRVARAVIGRRGALIEPELLPRP